MTDRANTTPQKSTTATHMLGRVIALVLGEQVVGIVVGAKDGVVGRNRALVVATRAHVADADQVLRHFCCFRTRERKRDGLFVFPCGQTRSLKVAVKKGRKGKFCD